jgi:SAM-dependent methyltransferase
VTGKDVPMSGSHHHEMNERTFHHANAHRLEDPERLTWLPPADVLAAIGVDQGWTVADVGAGTGYFSLPIARAVGPKGKVFAVDLQKEMLEMIREKLAATGQPENVELVEAPAIRTTLPGHSSDMVFMANIWHELNDHAGVLQETGRILRAGGVLTILDWRHDLPSPPGPPPDHRIPLASVLEVLEGNGWKILLSTTVGRYSYLLKASL